ncbi:MAG: hypothetical protein ACI35W_01885 [Anaeroplasmataceae bacterium]
MIFKLDKYYNYTRYKYVFIDGIMSLNKVNKETFLKEFGISYNSFRVEKSRNIVNNDNADRLLKYYNFNPIQLDKKSKYERTINRVYYSIYFEEYNLVNDYIKELNNYIEENNFLKPIFVLFKIFIMKKYNNIVENNDLDYILRFRNYFVDEIELIYEFILVTFKYKKEVILQKLAVKYKYLKWLYLQAMIELTNIKEDINKAYFYYKELETIFKNNMNIERLMNTWERLGFIYNSLKEYDKSITISSIVINYIYSIKNTYLIVKVLLNYLFSKFMLGEYDDIIELYDNDFFDINNLNFQSAIICILASTINNKQDKAKRIIDKFKNDRYVSLILDYLHTNNNKWELVIEALYYEKKFKNL